MDDGDAHGQSVITARQRGRGRLRHRVQAEVRCMHCGRSIGQVLAIAESGRLVEWPRDTPFAVFRSARPGAKSIRLSGVERFRCSTCGGFGIIEEVEQFATELFNDRVEKPPRRGRRPKPMVWRGDSRLEAFGLADPHGRPTAS